MSRDPRSHNWQPRDSDSGFYIDTFIGPSRFRYTVKAQWNPEAGPFESQEAATEWLESNRSKLMYPDAPTRIVWLGKEEI